MIDEIFSVSGHGVIVTGAGSGIGRAIAAGFAVRGALVTALDRDPHGLASLVSEHPTVRVVQGDAAEERVVASLVADHVKAWGRLDTVFANAGIAGAIAPTVQLPLEALQQVLRVNVESGFLLARESIPHFLEAGRGRIILTCSVWGVRGEASAPLTPYATSKGAVANLTRQLAVELAPYGVTVNALLPAAVETAIADGFYDDAAAVAGLLRHVPAGKVTAPNVMVGPAIFLASDASEWVTGQLLGVDGGYLAM
jgi:gluconate 5-dehydrogenase